MTRTSDTQYDNTREERYAISPSLLWQPDTDTSLLLRAYLQKDPSGGYHGSLPLDGTRYAHNGRKLSTSTNEGDPSDGYQRREQIYSYELTHQFMTSGRPTPPEAIPTPTSRWIRCIRSAGLMTATAGARLQRLARLAGCLVNR
jgi:hypothetical protein